MIKQLLIIIFLIFVFLLPTQFSFAKIFTSDIPDPLAQYQIKDEAKGILQRITGEWKKINDWGTNWKYATQLKKNIKQGWIEEKQEYRQDFFKTLGVALGKVKNFILHR